MCYKGEIGPCGYCGHAPCTCHKLTDAELQKLKDSCPDGPY